MMKLTFKPAAKTYLKTKIPKNSQVILTTDDGSNNYSSIGATCELADKFQLIILNQADPDFSVVLENNNDLQMHLLPAEQYLFGDNLNIDLVHDRLSLNDKSGILDSSLSVVDWRNISPETEAELREKMKKIGDQIC